MTRKKQAQPILYILIALLMAVSLAGCGSESESSYTTEAPDIIETLESPYTGVTTMDPADVEDFAAKVRQAYLDEDWETISELIDYPIKVNKTKIKNPKAFLSYMDGKKIYKSSRKAMKKESCAQMFTNGQGICMGDGEIWFLDVNFDGVEQTADPLLKIIAVQGIKE